MRKRELIALLNLSSWCLVMVERLFLAVPRGCLEFVILVFPDHTHLLFFISVYENGCQSDYRRIPQDTAGFPDIGVFNGIYHIITWNRHYIINKSKYLHLFCL